MGKSQVQKRNQMVQSPQDGTDGLHEVKKSQLAVYLKPTFPCYDSGITVERVLFCMEIILGGIWQISLWDM